MAPTTFHHPFQPYDIQLQFMGAVYDCIENGRVGIFESPTGTGKSLSLICGSLTWLRETKRRTFDAALASTEDADDEPDWMMEHAKDVKRKEAQQMRDDFEARLAAIREKEQGIRKRHKDGEPLRKRRKHRDQSPDDGDDESRFLLEGYSDNLSPDAPGGPNATRYSSETLKLLKSLGFMQKTNTADQVEMPEELKIYFCSRTHSQLSQFVGELERVRLPPGIPPAIASEEVTGESMVELLKHVSLGSRKNLCINPKVTKLSSLTAINERCLELQRGASKEQSKCGYLPEKEDESVLIDFRDHALSRVQDIEDLANVGKKLGICPYYATRAAISPAEMVTLPYPLLLQKTARDALGISLKGHVVIIDEAHNLIDAIEGIYSTQITSSQLTIAKGSLITYLQRFKNRLKGANRVYVAQLIRVLDSIMLFTESCSQEATNGGTLQASQLLSGKAADQIDLNKLIQYMSESKIARKVEGYMDFTNRQQAPVTAQKITSGDNEVPTLSHVQTFLGSLMNPAKEGRLFWAKEGKTIIVRYMLLDPSEHFREIVEEARAVILAGGTMSPISDYTEQLFPYLHSVSTLSCGHIIPGSSLLVRAVPSDSHGALEFNYKSRSTDTTISRLGDSLLQIAERVKGGLVVFFASYKYLEEVVHKWQSTGTMSALKNLKPTFCDSRTGSAESIFTEYSDAIQRDPSRGAVLFSVVGGKLSEGINFSDDLGRCVVVVGLPYPNLETPEWKAKLEYLENRAVAKGEPKGKAGREHAENVCMRAVNQAIGRVIRHRNDWASIILLGAPYALPRIQAKLPGWIKENLLNQMGRADDSLTRATSDLRTFFVNKYR